MPKTQFLGILEIFRLDIGQISLNLVKKASATWELAFLLLSFDCNFCNLKFCSESAVSDIVKINLSVEKKKKKSIAFYNILAQAWVQIKILRQKSDLRLSRLGFCIFFVHISGAIRLSTLIWVLLERSFPPAEVQYRWCQFLVKSDDVRSGRPRLVTACTGVYRLK